MYKKPFLENARSADPVVSEREIQNIFSNIESMYQFNKNLMKDLQKHRDDPSKPGLSDLFIELVRIPLYHHHHHHHSHYYHHCVS